LSVGGNSASRNENHDCHDSLPSKPLRSGHGVSSSRTEAEDAAET